MKVRELTDARNRLPEILDRASSGRERFLIRRRGRPVAAIVSTDDLDNLERDKPSPTGLAALAGLGLGDVHRGGIEVHGSWPRGQHRVRYLLDTDTISTTLKAAPPRCLIERIAATDPGALHISAITVGEMVYGSLRGSRAEDLIARFETDVWPMLKIVAFGYGEAQVYGRVRSLLERAGTPISEPDMQIAAIALANDMVFVTGNRRHFRHVPDLAAENWME